MQHCLCKPSYPAQCIYATASASLSESLSRTVGFNPRFVSILALLCGGRERKRTACCMAGLVKKVCMAWCVAKVAILSSVLLLWCAGCIRGGGAQTAFAIGTAALATESLQPKACLFVLGSIGAFRGMQLVVAHGGVSLEECVALEKELAAMPVSSGTLPLAPVAPVIPGP